MLMLIYEIQAYLQNMEITKYQSNFTEQNVTIKTTKQGKTLTLNLFFLMEKNNLTAHRNHSVVI